MDPTELQYEEGQKSSGCQSAKISLAKKQTRFKKHSRSHMLRKNFQKNRYATLKMSLVNLKNAIPKEISKRSRSRIGTIRLINLSTSYINYLKERVSNLEKEKKYCIKKSENNLDGDSFYVQGLFNGSIELIIFLIDSIRTKTTIDNFMKLTNHFFDSIREFHDIFLRDYDLKRSQLFDLLNSSEVAQSFPFKNTKLRKQALSMLKGDEDLSIKFLEDIISAPSLKHNSHRIELVESSTDDQLIGLNSFSESNSQDEITESSLQSTSPNDKSVSRYAIIDVPKYTNSWSVNSCSSESCFETRENEADEYSSVVEAKKLNMIENLNSRDNQSTLKVFHKPDLKSSGLTDDFPKFWCADRKQVETDCASTPKGDPIETCVLEKTANSSEYISVLMLHSTREFYIGGKLDKSLINQNLLSEYICNENYLPFSLHKVKADIDYSRDVLIP